MGYIWKALEKGYFIYLERLGLQAVLMTCLRLLSVLAVPVLLFACLSLLTTTCNVVAVPGAPT